MAGQVFGGFGYAFRCCIGLYGVMSYGLTKKCKASESGRRPDGSTSNFVDAMLVIVVGFLVFVIISWNMTAMIDPDTSKFH